MELVLAAPHLDGPGGVQTYLLTVAPQLERLGHEVTLYAPRQGLTAELARERGLRVADTEHELPGACDGVLAQDGASALALADRYPDAVRGIVVHGAEFDLHLPPGLPGTVAFAVALNDAAARRVRALAQPSPLTRLRQPIDAARFSAVGAVRERPRRALLLGNYLQGRIRATAVEACERAGLEWRQVGIHGELLLDPVAAISDADVVIGQGRSTLEAMACGRAALVWGPGAGDGWVTPDSYAALEADGFRGRATAALSDATALGGLLAGYEPGMGAANRRLAVLHHSPYEHAVGLVDALRGAVPTPVEPGTPLRELARLVRTQYDAQARVEALARDLRLAHEQGAQRDRELDAVRAQAAELERRLAEILATRRWRLSGLAARPLEALRRARSRG